MFNASISTETYSIINGTIETYYDVIAKLTFLVFLYVLIQYLYSKIFV